MAAVGWEEPRISLEGRGREEMEFSKPETGQ